MLKKLSFAAVLFSLLALAAIPFYVNAVQTKKTTNTVVKPVTPPKALFDGACVATAVATRDTTISSAWTTLGSAMASAISARSTALQAAWKLTEVKARKAAIKQAWADFRAAQKSAHSAFRTARMNAWKQFTTDSKACKAPKDDTTGSSADGASL